uniref:Uncharacterized protein n=1 Tax=Stomoxys calcitrans TaxID=35570 RepID=A0A1I8QDE9_STOCA
MDTSLVNNLIKSSLLPELKQDLDSIPIEKEHFKSYHDCLQVQLAILYDWVQQEQPRLWTITDETNESVNLKEIQANLIILLCEVTGPDYLHTLDNSDLIDNAERILAKFGKIELEVQELILKYYQEKLHKDSWKKQLGAIHGFIKYLKFLFPDIPGHDNHMNYNYLMFCLSVGLNIRTCYETHYKLLSTNVFLTMLNVGQTNDILSMNIHGVIYDAVFKDLHVMDTISFIQLQWKCVLKCFDFYTEMDSFTWSKLDDSMEILLRNITLAPNSLTSISLMKFVSKFVIYFNINQQELEEVLGGDLCQIDGINRCREMTNSNTSYTCFRWAKAILEMFVLESYRLMQANDICREMLLEIHRCYIVAIMPIPLSVIEPHLITFYDKFTAVLMEVIKVQKYKDDIVKIITSMLETFYYHLTNCDNLPNLLNYKEAYHKLLHVDVFKKFVTV